MKEPQFRYNPKTLRYERVEFSIWRTTGAFIGYVSFGVLFFVGLNLLQNLIIETATEKSLRAENNSLSEYKVVLASQIESSNETLGELKADEINLYEKIFESPAEREASFTESSADKVASTEGWDESMAVVNDRFNVVSKKAKAKNEFFGERLSMDKEDVTTLINFPSIAPVKDLNEQNLVSGFGVRINPFHKRNYHHDGIDIALTRGTEVLASGNGRVISINYSPLEAGLGNYVEIDHGNGLLTRYAHLEKINVTWGQKVTQGKVIAYSGSSGGSVAPHLHYEIIKNGKSLDPLAYIVEEISAERHQQLALKGKKQNQSLD